MEAYSVDLRQRICASYDDGDSVTEVAERHGVGRWFVHKLLRQRQEEGSIAPKAPGMGPPPRIGSADRKRIGKWLKDKPDTTLSELCGRLREEDGPSVSVPAMCRTAQALRLVLKKRRCTPASAIRHESGPYAGTSRSGSRKWTPGSWCSWTRAGSTPR